MNPYRIAAVLTLAALTSCAMAQTPITVQVVNDSGLSDSDVYLLLSGSDVDVVPSTGPAIAYPFSVSGISKTPVGTVVNTSGTLVTAPERPARRTRPVGPGARWRSRRRRRRARGSAIAAGGTASLTIGLHRRWRRDFDVFLSRCRRASRLPRRRARALQRRQRPVAHADSRSRGTTLPAPPHDRRPVSGYAGTSVTTSYW
jgi:hypothetical protein